MFKLLLLLSPFILLSQSAINTDEKITLKEAILNSYNNQIIIPSGLQNEYLFDKFDIYDALMKCDNTYLIRFMYDGNPHISGGSGFAPIEVNYQMGSYIWHEKIATANKLFGTYAYQNGEICPVEDAYKKGWLTESYLKWHEEYTIVVYGRPNKIGPREPYIDENISKNIIDAYSSLTMEEINNTYINV